MVHSSMTPHPSNKPLPHPSQNQSLPHSQKWKVLTCFFPIASTLFKKQPGVYPHHPISELPKFVQLRPNSPFGFTKRSRTSVILTSRLQRRDTLSDPPRFLLDIPQSSANIPMLSV